MMGGEKVGVLPMQAHPVVEGVVPCNGGSDQLAIRLHMLFQAIAFKFPASVCVVQAWLPKPSADEFSLYAEPRCAVVNDAAFQSFRFRSCHQPVLFKNSMTGRVWKTGAVQVVQNLRLVPPSMHPRIYLADADLDRLGEALYIPVYNQMRPGSGPITVLEALLPAHSPEPVIAADLLSFISAGLATLKLSVSNPLPQPIKRSALCGRRARAPVDSAPDMTSTVQEHGQEAPDAAGPAVPAAVKAISSPTAPTTGTCSHAKASVEEDTAAQPLLPCTAHPIASPCAIVAAEHAQQAHMSPGSASDGPSTTRVVCDDDLPDSLPRKVRKVSLGGMVRSKSRHHVMIAQDDVAPDVSNCQQDDEDEDCV